LGSHRSKVVRLAPSNYELPPMRSEEGATFEPAPGMHGEANEAILGVLRSEREPLSRSVIIERCGVEDVVWSPAIRQLVDAGAVEQMGIRRGAKYQLPQCLSSTRMAIPFSNQSIRSGLFVPVRQAIAGNYPLIPEPTITDHPSADPQLLTGCLLVYLESEGAQ
jgi:hypothetical protein